MKTTTQAARDTIEPASTPSRATSLGAVAFLVACVVMGVTETWFPSDRAPELKLQGVALERAEAELWEQSDFWDGGWFRYNERRLRYRSRLRDPFVRHWSTLRIGLFGEAGGAVRAGSDGWLFLDDRLRQQGAVSRPVERVAAARLSALARRLRLFGCALTVLPVPEKAVTVADAVPPRWDLDLATYDRFLTALRERDVAAIDLLAGWGDRSRAEPYSRTDTHWSLCGALVAAELVSESLGLRLDDEALPTALEEVHIVPDRNEPLDAGDLLEMSGLNTAFIHEPRWPEGMLYWLGRVHILRFFYPVEKDDAPDVNRSARALHVGSSFSQSSFFPLYLEHYACGAIRCLPFPATSTDGVGARALAELRQQPVPSLSWEIPVYQLYNEEDALGSIPALIAPLGVDLLRPIDRSGRDPSIGLKGLVAGHAVPKGTTVLGTWPLQHVGDGALSLKLEGRAQGDVVLRVRTGGLTTRVPLAPGPYSLAIPLVSPVPAREVSLAIDSEQDTRLEITGADWVGASRR